MTIFMVILNGFISLPLFNQNIKLQESVTELSNNNNEEFTKEIAQNTNQIEDILTNTTSNSSQDSVNEAMQAIIDKQNKTLDSIKATLTIAHSTPERITKIENIKTEMATSQQIILDPKTDRRAKFMASQKLKTLNFDLQKVAIEPTK